MANSKWKRWKRPFRPRVYPSLMGWSTGIPSLKLHLEKALDAILKIFRGLLAVSEFVSNSLLTTRWYQLIPDHESSVEAKQWIWKKYVFCLDFAVQLPKRSGGFRSYPRWCSTTFSLSTHIFYWSCWMESHSRMSRTVQQKRKIFGHSHQANALMANSKIWGELSYCCLVGHGRTGWLCEWCSWSYRLVNYHSQLENRKLFSDQLQRCHVQ